MASVVHTPPNLTRQQRRRLERLAEKVDRVLTGDVAFFRRFPERNHRIRLMSAPEREQLALMNGREDVPTAPGEEWIVAIKQLATGVRMRRFLPAMKGADLDQPEEACRRLYEAWTSNSHADHARYIERALRTIAEGRARD